MKQRKYKKIENSYKKTGYNVIPLSCLKGTGFEKLEEVLKDRITVFAGTVRSREVNNSKQNNEFLYYGNRRCKQKK